MLRRGFLMLSTFGLIAACHTSAVPNESRTDVLPTLPTATDPNGVRAAPTAGAFAVVELFTSEGCNSCPPADAALATLAAEPREDRTLVYALSFHVDYWDSLGWKDPHSTASNTARQHQYARVFGTSSVYTPQMIVNGSEQLVGSDLGHARSSIRRVAATPTTLAITIEQGAGSSLSVRHRIGGAPSGAVLHVALVEKSTDTNVRAGENSGKKLHHVNVVRRFVTDAKIDAEGTTTLDVPSDLDASNAEIIAYVQRISDDGAPIVAAARASISPR